MSEQVKAVRALATSRFEELLAATTRRSMRERLTAVNDACIHLVRAGAVPNFTNISEWIAQNRASCIIPDSTFHNKRKNKETGQTERGPFLQIMDAWADVAHSMKLDKGGRKDAVTVEKEAEEISLTGVWITSEELRAINKVDGPTAHKVNVLLNLVQGFVKQGEYRRAIKENPKAPFLTGEQQALIDGGQGLMLSEIELDAIEDFLDEGSAARRGIEFDETGTVIAKRVEKGAEISDPGFVEALRKIVKSNRGSA